MLVSTGGLDTAVLIWDRLVVSEVDEPGQYDLWLGRRTGYLENEKSHI